MTDLSQTIVPKSDQLNADDLISGPMILHITDVRILAGDQPVAIHYEGGDKKPYKPCKSMRRVLVRMWGTDGQAYIGRALKVHLDPTVTFGKQQVGGIRISHMTNIEEDMTMMLTTTRGKRAPYKVCKLTTLTEEQKAIKAALSPLYKEKGQEVVAEILSGLGVSRIDELPDGSIDKVMEMIQGNG
jgi:hypothetical protein